MQNKLKKIAEIMISYSSLIPPIDRIQIKQSADAYALLFENWDKETIELQESFKVILLNRANEVIGLYTCSSGGTAGTVVDAKLIFSVALKANAHCIILAHNHPSCNLKPSKADLSLTKKLVNAGAFLDITVLDHIIMSSYGYYSFKDEGEI